MELVPNKNFFGINENRQNKLTSRIYYGVVSPSFGLFGPCNMLGLLLDVNRGPWIPLRLYNH